VGKSEALTFPLKSCLAAERERGGSNNQMSVAER